MPVFVGEMKRSEPVSHVEFVIACITALLLVAAVAAVEIYDRVQMQRAAGTVQSLNADASGAAHSPRL